MKINVDVGTLVSNLDQSVMRASHQFDQWLNTNDDWSEPSWLIETSFLQLITTLEALSLSGLQSLVEKDYGEMRNLPKGFSQTDITPDGEHYSIPLARLRQFLATLKVLLPPDERTTITRDLLQIIRNIHYSITDTAIFASVPRNENDVHRRIEAILKCVFPDLKHKPSISKQIKNFEPDTGIPSIATLVEYKYLSCKEDAKRVADELLADTRGYFSKDWQRFLYVIYETERFRTEDEWNQMMRESGVGNNTSVVVLCGIPYVATVTT